MDIPIVTSEGGPSPAAVARAARDQARLEAPPPPPKPPPAPELPPEPGGYAHEQAPAPQRIVHDQQSRRGGQMVVPLVVFLVVALLGWGIVTGTGGDEGAADDAGEQAGPDLGERSPDIAAAGVDDGDRVIDATHITPEDAFTYAAGVLEWNGSFTYAGTVRAEGTSPLRPTEPIAAEVGVVGNVRLPGRVQEVALDQSGGDGVVETIVIADDIWQRQAATADELERTVYGRSSNDDLWLGAALLPQWLDRVTGSRDIGTAPDGAHSFAGNLVIRHGQGLDGQRSYEVIVTFNTDGEPREVRIDQVGEGSDLSIAWVIDDIGDVPAVSEPSPDDISVDG